MASNENGNNNKIDRLKQKHKNSVFKLPIKKNIPKPHMGVSKTLQKLITNPNLQAS